MSSVSRVRRRQSHRVEDQHSTLSFTHIHTMATPDVTLTHLNRADGSATYTHNGFSLIGAVNGPIEVQRRDEIPDEATLEVNVRPAVGVGSTSLHPDAHYTRHAC
jgi:hypothetical protein